MPPAGASRRESRRADRPVGGAALLRLTAAGRAEQNRAVGAAPFLAMWVPASAAMMLPSTTPLLRLYHAVTGSWPATASFAAGYLSVWISFGLVAFSAGALGPYGRTATALALGTAAVYQVTPPKRRSLARCRAPLGRILHGRRESGFLMGAENGLWCAGCCAGLMLALLALGAMDLRWMAVGAVVIAGEKVARGGFGLSRVVAVGLAVGAVAVWLA